MRLSTNVGIWVILAGIPLTSMGQDPESTTISPVREDGKPPNPRDKNEGFTIGMFGAHSMRLYDGGCEAPPTTPWLSDGRATSSLNITAADGFTAWQTYINAWYTPRQLTRMLGLSKDLGLKLLLSFHQYYEPSTDANNNYLGTGTNIYNGCGINYSACEAPANYGKDRHNIDQLLDYACSNSNVSDALMGIQITEEASSCHYYPDYVVELRSEG